MTVVPQSRASFETKYNGMQTQSAIGSSCEWINWSKIPPHVAFVDGYDMMVGAEFLRDQLGILELIQMSMISESDRKGVHRPVHELRHQSDIGRGIDTAGQKHPKGDVRHHAALDGFAKTGSYPIYIEILALPVIQARYSLRR